MPLFKKIAKAAGKAAKRGGKLAGKIAKKTVPYGAGRVGSSLARGKTPKISDVMTMFGVPLIKKGGSMSKFKKLPLKKRLRRKIGRR